MKHHPSMHRAHVEAAKESLLITSKNARKANIQKHFALAAEIVCAGLTVGFGAAALTLATSKQGASSIECLALSISSLVLLGLSVAARKATLHKCRTATQDVRNSLTLLKVCGVDLGSVNAYRRSNGDIYGAAKTRKKQLSLN